MMSTFVYSSGRRYGKSPRVFQVLQDGRVRAAVAYNVTVAEHTVQEFADMDAFIAALGGTTPKPKKTLKRRRRKNEQRKKTPRKKSNAN